MIKKAVILIGIIFTCTFGNVLAQNFYGGLAVGPVITQYNGDGRGGYNKIGPKVGFFVTREMSDSWNYQMELYFLQKGSKYADNKNFDYYNLRLRYIELPLSLQYHMEGIHIGSFINTKFKNPVYPEFGFSVAYLLDAKEDSGGNGLEEPIKPFDSFDICAHIGINYHFTERFIFHFRYSYSILPIREYPGDQVWRLDRGEYNNVLHFTLYYKF
jgi:hypothetical protein